MISISAASSATLKKALKDLERLEKQSAFATRVAITRLASKVAVAERTALPQVFDRPTSFTLRSILNVQSKTGSKGYVRIVKIRDEAADGNAPEKYLRPQIEGGPRGAKGFERAFAFDDSDLANNVARTKQLFGVPGKAAPLDRFGNVPASIINRIISGVGVSRYGDQNTTAKGKKRYPKRAQYFAGKAGPGRRTLAIWQRQGPGLRGIKPVFVAVERVGYKKRFDFFGIGETLVARDYQSEFSRALDEAIRTAR